MVPAGLLELRLKQNNYEDVRRHPPESLIGWVFSVSEENMSTERGKDNGSRKSIAGSMLAAACTIFAVVVLAPDAYAGFGSEMNNVGNIIQKLAVCGGERHGAGLWRRADRSKGKEENRRYSGCDGSCFCASYGHSVGTGNCLRLGLVASEHALT